MKVDVKTMEPFPPNSNPFQHDYFNMGQQIGENLVMMFRNHPHEKMKYLILVDTKTGKRVAIDIEQDEEPSSLERAADLTRSFGQGRPWGVRNFRMKEEEE